MYKQKFFNFSSKVLGSSDSCWKDVFNVIFPIYFIVYVDTEKFCIGHK